MHSALLNINNININININNINNINITNINKLLLTNLFNKRLKDALCPAQHILFQSEKFKQFKLNIDKSSLLYDALL